MAKKRKSKSTKSIKSELGRHHGEWLKGIDDMVNQPKVRQRLRFKEAEELAERLINKKPKGMSKSEWFDQIARGEAMVQNPQGWGREKGTEFIITTVHDPKEKKRRAAKVRAKAKLEKYYNETYAA